MKIVAKSFSISLMNLKQFKQLERKIKETINLLQEEALKNGEDILSPGFQEVVEKTKERILSNYGLTLEEYDKLKAKLKPSKGLQVIYPELEVLVEELKEKIDKVPKDWPTFPEKIKLEKPEWWKDPQVTVLPPKVEIPPIKIPQPKIELPELKELKELKKILEKVSDLLVQIKEKKLPEPKEIQPVVLIDPASKKEYKAQMTAIANVPDTLSVSVSSVDAKLKNKNDQYINPAQEDGNLADIKTNTAKLDILLSSLRDAITAASPNNKTLNDLYTQLGNLLTELQQKTEPTDIQAIGNPPNLDVLLSSRASEATLNSIKTKTDNLDVALSTRMPASGGSVKIEGTTKTILQAEINFNTLGDNTIVAANETKKIKVVSCCLTVGGETNLTFKRGTTPISGPMDFGGANEPRGMVANGTVECPVLETGVNEAFIINSSNAVQVSGWVRYYLE